MCKCWASVLRGGKKISLALGSRRSLDFLARLEGGDDLRLLARTAAALSTPPAARSVSSAEWSGALSCSTRCRCQRAKHDVGTVTLNMTQQQSTYKQQKTERPHHIHHLILRSTRWHWFLPVNSSARLHLSPQLAVTAVLFSPSSVYLSPGLLLLLQPTVTGIHFFLVYSSGRLHFSPQLALTVTDMSSFPAYLSTGSHLSPRLALAVTGVRSILVYLIRVASLISSHPLLTSLVALLLTNCRFYSYATVIDYGSVHSSAYWE